MNTIQAHRASRLRLRVLLGALLGAWLLACAAPPKALGAEELDEVFLKNGKKFEGKIFKEDAQVLFLRLANGEQIGLARRRIEKIVRADSAAAPKDDPKVKPAPAATRRPRTPAKQPGAPPAPMRAFPLAMSVPAAGERKDIFEALKDLGDSQRAKRKAALERAKDLGFRAVPVLLAIFHPKQKQPPERRMGALRALAELGPLDRQGALTLAWIAMKDPDFEVRREAARTIRLLKEDRAKEYLLHMAVHKDKQTAYAAAAALREINDDRTFAALAGAIPQPTVNAAQPETQPAELRRIDLPVGPLGTKLPVFLPNQAVAGTAENITSPPADALKWISGKNLGSLPGVWINWLNEKAGTWTHREREEAYRNRSMLNRMGSPQVQGGP